MKKIGVSMGLVAIWLAATSTPAFAAGLGQTGGELDTLGEALGVLGLFAAVMIILALGTEVVIEMVKMFIGFKGKPSSLKSVRELGDWLPGTLKELGVSSAGQGQIHGYLAALDGMLKDVDRGAEAVTRIENWLPEKLKDLAVEGADRLWETQGPAFLERLQADLNLGQPILDKIHDSLRLALKGLEATSSAQIEEYLTALTNLLQGVENRRYQIQSPLRQVLRWIRDIPYLGWLVEGPERVLNWLRNDPSDPRHPDQVPQLTPGSVAKYLLERESFHKDQEQSRLRWLRILSIAVGVVLAVKLNIDAGQLLLPLIGPDYAATLTRPLFAIQADPFFAGWFLLGGTWFWLKVLLNAMTAGMLLSGLGASAGSAFWHDQLDRLQSAKQAQARLQSLVDEVRKVAGGE